MSAKKWQQLAEALEYEQLAGARKLAEGWRTGLAGLTALLATVTIVKGPDTIADLAGWARYTIVAALLAAFILLVAGSLAAVRAASGQPGAQVWLDGDALREWTFAEAEAIQAGLLTARRCTVGGLALLAVAVGFTWLGPRPAGAPLVRVDVGGATACGTLTSMDERSVVLTVGGKATVVPVGPGLKVAPVRKC